MIIGQKKIFIGAHIVWWLMILLILVVLAGGPGVHLGLWSPLNGFMLSMMGSFLGGLALAVLSLIVVIIIAIKEARGGMARAVMALCAGLVLAAPVGYLRVSDVPPIHDITTDLANPPEFMALVGNRGEKANSLTYDVDERAQLTDMQSKYYPEIEPLLVPRTPQTLFARALEVATLMGWQITGVDTTAHRFEATDRTFWFDFADDIVVVITQTENGSRLDMRSISRVGISDLGANAKRIMAFQKKLLAQL
ncbi:hypothetical protein MNBD_ALPHA01-353 [hydrothermal vent metagenome]|uniref:DUF1499 domain-containing protein n=1 Tax=hydrothermal vent metagenome TaxID=652676 RepID=A0A3B0S8Y7_9ZZZZ